MSHFIGFDMCRLNLNIYNLFIWLKTAGRVVESAGPDQKPRFVAVIWVYTVSSGLSVQILKVNTLLFM